MSNEQQGFFVEKRFAEKLKSWMGCPVITLTPEICEAAGVGEEDAERCVYAITDDAEGLHTVMAALVLSEPYGWDDETVMAAMVVNNREGRAGHPKFRAAMERRREELEAAAKAAAKQEADAREAAGDDDETPGAGQ